MSNKKKILFPWSHQVDTNFSGAWMRMSEWGTRRGIKIHTAYIDWLFTLKKSLYLFLRSYQPIENKHENPRRSSDRRLHSQKSPQPISQLVYKSGSTNESSGVSFSLLPRACFWSSSRILILFSDSFSKVRERSRAVPRWSKQRSWLFRAAERTSA